MAKTDVVVVASSLSKAYETGDARVEVLDNVNLDVRSGEMVIIGGVSGSGKTTFLNIIAGIDKPTGGKIVVFDEDLGSRTEDFLARFRCSHIGFVFQSYNLVSTLTVAENIAFPMEWLRKPENQVRTRVEQLVENMELKKRAHHFPFQLSGGEQQRVAFARALSNDPPLLLVDEPTGNLDKKTGTKLVETLRLLNDSGKTVIIATHDEQMFGMADRRLWLEDGKLLNWNE
jgi:putative ABC transport system ATP-binding protein